MVKTSSLLMFSLLVSIAILLLWHILASKANRIEHAEASLYLSNE